MTTPDEQDFADQHAAEVAFSLAVAESDAAFALREIGSIIKGFAEGDERFSRLEDRQLVAIGICIRHLADSLCKGSIGQTLERLTEPREDA